MKSSQQISCTMPLAALHFIDLNMKLDIIIARMANTYNSLIKVLSQRGLLSILL